MTVVAGVTRVTVVAGVAGVTRVTRVTVVTQGGGMAAMRLMQENTTGTQRAGGGGKADGCRLEPLV